MATEKNDIRKLDESVGFHPEINFGVKLKIKNVDVPANSIINIIVREWIFDILPRLELTISDNGRYIDQFPLEDNDVIELEVNNFVLDSPPIKSEFLLQDYEIKNSGPGKKEQALIVMTGLLKTKFDIYKIKNRAFSNQNSSEVFNNVFNEFGLKSFESRVNPKDEMNWLQTKENNINFIHHVLSRSYINNDDTPFLYTNRKGKMIYTSLRTEIKKKVENIPIFVYNLESAILNSKNYSQEDLVEKLEEEQEQEKEGTFYFYNWMYRNLSGGINKTNSYGRKLSYYDLTNSLEQEIKTDQHPLSIHSLKEKNKIGKIVYNDEYGILDSSNTHSNYFLAQSQNKYLREDFFGSYLMLYTRPSDNINLFDRVSVNFPSLLNIEGAIDEVHSGQYIVGGIIHEASKDSIYNNILILFRNGLNVKGLLKDFESRHSSESVEGAEITDPVVPPRNVY